RSGWPRAEHEPPEEAERHEQEDVVEHVAQPQEPRQPHPRRDDEVERRQRDDDGDEDEVAEEERRRRGPRARRTTGRAARRREVDGAAQRSRTALWRAWTSRPSLSLVSFVPRACSSRRRNSSSATSSAASASSLAGSCPGALPPISRTRPSTYATSSLTRSSDASLRIVKR